MESVIAGKCHKWIVSELECGNCWKVSELSDYRENDPTNALMAILIEKNNIGDFFWSISGSKMANQTLFVSFWRNLRTPNNSDTFKIQHFPILTLSSSDTFLFPILTPTDSENQTLSNFADQCIPTLYSFSSFVLNCAYTLKTVKVYVFVWYLPIAIAYFLLFTLTVFLRLLFSSLK